LSSAKCGVHYIVEKKIFKSPQDLYFSKVKLNVNLQKSTGAALTGLITELKRTESGDRKVGLELAEEEADFGAALSLELEFLDAEGQEPKLSARIGSIKSQPVEFSGLESDPFDQKSPL
jgi:hypothetical protein